MAVECSITKEDVFRILDSLPHAVSHEALLRATKKGAEALKKATEDSLLQKGGPAMVGLLKGTSRSWSSDTLSRGHTGIGMEKARYGTGYVVSIAQSHSDFRLHWVENGTVMRTKKGGVSTGQMRGLEFFADAREEYADRIETDMVNELASLIKL